jgi:hypothetical protein
MTKLDDSSLDPDQLRAVEGRAKNLLDRASAWSIFPAPVEIILDPAKLKVAPPGIFDPAAIMAYLKGRAANVASVLKSSIAKVFGIYDSLDSLIHIDANVVGTKQTFLKFHETGHHELPTHRKVFKIFQDCEKNLSPEVADLFEREANNFARYLLFKGETYTDVAADCAMEIKTPMKLAKTFGASIYASCREFARGHHRACVVYVLEPISFHEGTGAKALVRRIEPSPSFKLRFGTPSDLEITLDHALGPLLPIGRKMTKPRTLKVLDLRGEAHECVAEAFDTTHNVVILLYPVKALTGTTIIVPSRRDVSFDNQPF